MKVGKPDAESAAPRESSLVERLAARLERKKHARNLEEALLTMEELERTAREVRRKQLLKGGGGDGHAVAAPHG